MSSGVFGDMMLTYFKGKGGLGVVVDGCIRDFPKVQKLGLGIWTRGLTPNFHTQTSIFPYAVNVPVACGGVFVMPGESPPNSRPSSPRRRRRTPSGKTSAGCGSFREENSGSITRSATKPGPSTRSGS
jgi:hypothetical protein